MGRIISLEGIDFTWKTPIARKLVEDMEGMGIPCVLTRDPPYWLTPWDTFQEFFEKENPLSKMAEAFLLLAARLDNFERVVRPALETKLVIMDRYIDSWFAYQSVRLSPYFGEDARKALDFLIDLHVGLEKQRFLFSPDLTILIVDSPVESMGRAKPEEIASKYEVLSIQKAVAQMYDELSKRFNRIVPVRIKGRGIEEVYSEVLGIVKDYLRMFWDKPLYPGAVVEAVENLAWSIGEFEDAPLFIKPGDRGMVTAIEGFLVWVQWNKADKHLRTCVNLQWRSTLPFIVISG